ncbi:MAG: 50S ribosomal protein L11 [Desulfurococcaceae archaeon]|jgi:large subunit ribosomal protein L11|nr:50S ribosomal protein L11 [Desulfurococcaceae archaeon]
MVKKTLKFIIEGGKATPGPPIGPALSPYKVNVVEVVNAINNATKDYEGLPIPVEVTIDTDNRKFEVKVGIPTTTALLMKFAGAKEPTGDPAHKKIGDVKFEDIIKIAILKKEQLSAKTLKSAVKTILGTARAVGVTIEGKDPREVVRLIDQGFYDELIKRYEDEWNKS